MIAVADTSVVSYLVLIDQSHLLPQLFSSIVIPEEVRAELAHGSAPEAVRAWISAPPSWLRVEPVELQLTDAELKRLHPGERAAITLALQRKASLVLLDEKMARSVARGRGLRVAGLLGILKESANRRLVDLPSALEALSHTSFRAAPRLLRSLLEDDPVP